MIGKRSSTSPRRGRRPLGIAVAAAVVSLGVVGGMAAPAMAWSSGGVQVSAPAFCTGHATGKSWKSTTSATVYASTAESGNACLVITTVSAGLRLSGSDTLWNGVSGVSFAQASASSSGGYIGGWHRWGGKVAS